MTKVLLLHPGAMGASVGAALASLQHEVFWVSTGRSPVTRDRAERAGLVSVSSLSDGVSKADIVISICPPEFALSVATEVQALNSSALYVDANAISPATASEIEGLLGDRLVDGSIIGPPAWQADLMRLYLSGIHAAEIAGLFQGSFVNPRVCGAQIGKASALKMAYAGFSKGSSALILAIRALAEHYGVTETLLEEWSLSSPDLIRRAEGTAKGVSPKAWRFEGEMLEISRCFKDAELPDQFHAGAAALFHLMARFKDQPAADIESVINEILARR